MSLVELSELNGRAGNPDYFQKSREAERLVLASVARFLQRPIEETPGEGKHACDFTTSRGLRGDVKIFSQELVYLEVTQIRRGVVWPGWYQEYLRLDRMGGLLTLNTRFSRYHNGTVIKIRWLPWRGIVGYAETETPHENRFGSFISIDPTRIEHYWLGDYLTVASRYGEDHIAFDTSRIHANNQLNIPALLEWF
jgi:hypothetical protein